MATYQPSQDTLTLLRLPLHQQWAILRDNEDANDRVRRKQVALARFIESEAYKDVDEKLAHTAKALAKLSCSQCMGLGCMVLRAGKIRRICSCVYRAAFRKCLKKYHQSISDTSRSLKCTIERSGAGTICAGFKYMEFKADVELVAKRSLNADDFLIFKWHLLHGQDWQGLAPKVGLDRGNFFHAVYRIEEYLGKVFLELKPYPLCPTPQYFAASRVYAGQMGKQFTHKRMHGGDFERKLHEPY